MQKNINKVVLYVEWFDACCGYDYENASTFVKSHSELLENKEVVALVYLVDEITGDEWGDDWNDAPACCNSGSPYTKRCKGLEIVELKLGNQIFKSK